MQVGFICPDTVTITHEECLRKCRLGQRCLTLATLNELSKTREWTGKPSTTQCLQGTRKAYLEVVTPYCITPEDQAFNLLGTTHHQRLEESANSMGLPAEIKLEDAGITGIFDNLEPEGPGYILNDYKTWGSYRVAKFLGIESYKEADPDKLYKRSGAWGQAGTPVMVKKFRINSEKAETAELELQLSNYAWMLEPAGYPITRIQVQITVRDGGLQAARDRGIDKLIYLLPVRKLPIMYTQQYFAERAVAIKRHITTNTIPHACTLEERWNGILCKSYCNVWFACDVGRDAHRNADKVEELE